MVSVSEVFKAWQEAFDNKDSSKLAELLTDDFQFVSARRTMNKQEALDWAAGGGNETVMDNLEVLHETDEVSVTCHTANSTLGADGLVMVFYTKRDGKISHGRIVRQEL
tara:strand:- start:121 stop:447 length:327 start_codon:yes stop_codon:yes gene_type:complete